MKNKNDSVSQWDRMVGGRLYNCTDWAVMRRHIRALAMCDAYNRTRIYWFPRRQRLLRRLLPHAAKGCFILNNFHCEYGDNITLGCNFFANFDCKMLDVAPITIGDNVMLGANVTLATPVHPLVADERIIQQYPDGYHDLEYAKPITIGNNVWLASGVTVCGGVTVGDNVVVGAGSVVTRDLPADTFCCGVPCRVVRPITDMDRIDAWQTYMADSPPVTRARRRKQ